LQALDSTFLRAPDLLRILAGDFSPARG